MLSQCPERWIEWIRWVCMVDGGLPQDEAEDGATPILLSYYRRTGSYPWQQPMPDVPLLRTLCHDYANAFWRKQKRRDRLLERWMTLSSDGYRSVEAAAIDELCASEFLDSLPPRLRELVRYRLQGNTCPQIAEKLGVSAGTVQAYLRDLRQLFKKFFGYDLTKRGGRDSNSYGKIEGREDMNDEDSQTDTGGQYSSINGLLLLS